MNYFWRFEVKFSCKLQNKLFVKLKLMQPRDDQTNRYAYRFTKILGVFLQTSHDQNRQFCLIPTQRDSQTIFWLKVHTIILSKLEVEVKCKCQRSALPSITDMLPPAHQNTTPHHYNPRHHFGGLHLPSHTSRWRCHQILNVQYYNQKNPVTARLLIGTKITLCNFTEL